jgi:hypothetical protein
VLKWFERGRLWTSPQEARGPAPSPSGPPDRRGKDGGRVAPIAIRATGSRRTRSPGPEGTTTGEGRRRPIVHALTVQRCRPRDERPRDDRGPGAPRRPWQPKTDPRAPRRRQENGPIARGDPSPIRRVATSRGAPNRPAVDSRPAVAAQTPGQRAGRPAMAAKADGRSGRTTVAVKADRLGRAASVEAEAARRRSGTRVGPCGQAAVAAQTGADPTNVPGRQSQKAAIDRGGPSRRRPGRQALAAQTAERRATSRGGPSRGPRRQAVAAKASRAHPTGRGGPSLRRRRPENLADPSPITHLRGSPGGPSRMEERV